MISRSIILSHHRDRCYLRSLPFISLHNMSRSSVSARYIYDEIFGTEAIHGRCRNFGSVSLNTSNIKTRDYRYGFGYRRMFSSSSQGKDVFNKQVKLIQRTSAATATNSMDYDYFRDEVSRRLVDRLDDIRRENGFPLALDIGAGSGHVHRAICADESFDGVGGIGGVRKLVQLDSCESMLMRDVNAHLEDENSNRCDTYRLVASEEDTLQFPDGTFDLVLSSVSLHQVNDLPKLFAEVKRILKDDGCFMFAMVGGTSLPELRSSFVLAEMERKGGVRLLNLSYLPLFFYAYFKTFVGFSSCRTFC